jgi:hypothetical protein
MAIQDQATVDVKSAWLSKINWIQVVALAGTTATGLIGAFNLDPVTAAKVTAIVAIVGQVATVIVKTFFTSTVTPSSVK